MEGISTGPVDRVRDLVAERLGERGWYRLGDDPPSWRDRYPLAKALRDGFFATLLVELWLDDIDFDNESTKLCAVGVLGLDYEPARRITTALTGSPISGVVLREPCLSIALTNESNADAAANSLARFATEHVTALAELAALDKVLGLLRESRAAPSSEPLTFLRGDDPPKPPPGYRELPDPVTVLIPVLLAAAGHYEEARGALGACAEPSWLQLAGKHDLRLVRQLTRWIESEGELPLPKTPARWPAQWPRPVARFDRPGFRAVMAEQRPVVQARQQATRVVRAVSEGKSREEIRQLLRVELDKRDVKMQPVELERTVDFLATEREPFGKARLVLRGFNALKDLGGQGRPRVVQTSGGPPPEPEEQPDPAWSKTPEQAAYPVWSATMDRLAVELDAGAVVWLDELMSGSRGRFGNRKVEVWLSKAEPKSPGASALIVHVGSKRIGSLDPQAAAAFHSPIDAAAERDEDVTTDAHLTRMEGTPRYVLDLPVP